MTFNSKKNFGYINKAVVLGAAFVMLFGCNGVESLTQPEPETPGDKTRAHIASLPKADIEVMMVGNSHTSTASLSIQLEDLLEAGTGKSALVVVAPTFGFLSDTSSVANDMLQLRNWTHVILQGQKYSQSRTQEYPTTGAERWVKLVKQQGALPILYPEHPQRDNLTEAAYIHSLHLKIVASEPACIAPVGLTWDAVRAQTNLRDFYQADGNHINRNGAFLTAMVLYQTITAAQSKSLPLRADFALGENAQLAIAQAVDDVAVLHPPCVHLSN